MDEQTSTINEQNLNTPNFAELSREQLVDYLRDLVDNKEISSIKDQVELIKIFFYKRQQTGRDTSFGSEIGENRQPSGEMESDEETIAAGNDNGQPENETDTPSSIEAEYKAVMAIYREKRAAYKARIEAEQEANYQKKKEIISQLEALVSSTDDLSETLPTFRNLQAEWKNIGQVPAAVVNDIWKEYNYYQEQFYDLIKINAALREYDFKKNLEAKYNLIFQAEELQKEEDIVKAFKTLQLLHDKWREIGPIARELREEVWARFKDVSSAINRKHQAFFEQLKEQEQVLTAELEKICTDIESIKLDALTTYRQWEDEAEKVIATNVRFRPVTPTERRVVSKLYKRYRQACNVFFEAKNEYYKKIKDELQANYDKKKKLVEKAEQLKNSTQWVSATNQLIALQKEWKTIGPVAKKYSDAIWQRFTAACDHFFSQKEINLKQQKNEEQQNLQLKYEVIEAIKNYQLTGNDDDDFSNLRNLADKYQVIGHVPYKEKDSVYKAFKEATNEKFGLLRSKRRSAQLSFGNDLNKLTRQYESLKQQIATYENNIGFFSNNNSKQNTLVRDLEQKIKNLKLDLKIISEKINDLSNNG